MLSSERGLMQLFSPEGLRALGAEQPVAPKEAAAAASGSTSAAAAPTPAPAAGAASSAVQTQMASGLLGAAGPRGGGMPPMGLHIPAEVVAALSGGMLPEGMGGMSGPSEKTVAAMAQQAAAAAQAAQAEHARSAEEQLETRCAQMVDALLPATGPKAGAKAAASGPQTAAEAAAARKAARKEANAWGKGLAKGFLGQPRKRRAVAAATGGAVGNRGGRSSCSCRSAIFHF